MELVVFACKEGVDIVFCPDFEFCFGFGIHIRQIQISEFEVQVSFLNQSNSITRVLGFY